MNLPEILTELEIPFKQGGEHRHVTTGWVGLETCPFCGSEEYHLGIALSSLAVKCWRCGGHGLVESLAEASGRPWHAIKRLLGDVEGEERKERPQGKLVLPSGLGPMLPCHKEYLRGRGFDPDQLEREWGLQGIGLAARLSWRIFIPILWQAKIASWTTRSLSDEGTRYVNAKPQEESIRAKSILFGAEKARHAIIVVEGPLDCFRIGPGAAATLGVGWTQSQLRAIARFPVRAVVFDSDPMAQERARELCEALPGKTYRVCLDAPDPGSASEKEVQLLRRSFL